MKNISKTKEAAVNLAAEGFLAEAAFLLQGMIDGKPIGKAKTPSPKLKPSPTDRAKGIKVRPEYQDAQGNFDIQLFYRDAFKYLGGLPHGVKVTVILLKKYFQIGDRYAIMARNAWLKSSGVSQMSLLH